MTTCDRRSPVLHTEIYSMCTFHLSTIMETSQRGSRTEQEDEWAGLTGHAPGVSQVKENSQRLASSPPDWKTGPDCREIRTATYAYCKTGNIGGHYI